MISRDHRCSEKIFLTLFAQVSPEYVWFGSSSGYYSSERDIKKSKEKKIIAIDNIQMDTLIRGKCLVSFYLELKLQ